MAKSRENEARLREGRKAAEFRPKSPLISVVINHAWNEILFADESFFPLFGINHLDPIEKDSYRDVQKAIAESRNATPFPDIAPKPDMNPPFSEEIIQMSSGA